MHSALEEKETPYRFVVTCLALVIRHRWGAREVCEQERARESGSLQSDPLHAFPVAGMDFDDAGLEGGCGGNSCGPTCGEEIDVVPLNDTFPANTKDAVP